MRIVLDTNVVLSALLWRGTTYRLLDALRQHSSTQILSSATLLEELADVLTRPSATQRLALIDKTAAKVLADYVEIIELVAPTTVPRVVPGDIDDDQVIAAAVAAQADFIVSGDRTSTCCRSAVMAASPSSMPRRHCAGSRRSRRSAICVTRAVARLFCYCVPARCRGRAYRRGRPRRGRSAH